MRDMSMKEADLVVIGGGAAGMMCALTSAERGVKTVLLDGNRMLGRKVRITGKGRCNVTNNCDIKQFMANIHKFLIISNEATFPKNIWIFGSQFWLPFINSI